ncbi:hypothetical protein Mal15_19500 [Stieleria maiorica]|uniref:Uncharacterized protein n=1 Tax=Stieleria maiorica TaxID=2795974 RepID=A0A5B9MEB1_9BACT|nr:hypothetical protein [Stieleria maiorica]QEF97904.1 hypothetical protein Mal15_19500 [Stieleria maiorica]
MHASNSYVVSMSHVEGQFNGYIGGKDYRLGDGSVWRIITPIYAIRKKLCPQATVIRWSHRHFMFVRGMERDVEVEAVCLPRCILETPLKRPEKQELQEQFAIPHLTQRALAGWKVCVAQQDG